MSGRAREQDGESGREEGVDLLGGLDRHALTELDDGAQLAFGAETASPTACPLRPSGSPESAQPTQITSTPERNPLLPRTSIE
jgi:hypothetical protein